MPLNTETAAVNPRVDSRIEPRGNTHNRNHNRSGRIMIKIETQIVIMDAHPYSASRKSDRRLVRSHAFFLPLLGRSTVGVR